MYFYFCLLFTKQLGIENIEMTLKCYHTSQMAFTSGFCAKTTSGKRFCGQKQLMHQRGQKVKWCKQADMSKQGKSHPNSALLGTMSFKQFHSQRYAPLVGSQSATTVHQTLAVYLKTIAWGIKPLTTNKHSALTVCRYAFPPTSAQTWRICWEICCRWTWPSALATSGTESMISRATSGSPPLIGSPSTRGRWEASLHTAVMSTNVVHFWFLIFKRENKSGADKRRWV